MSIVMQITDKNCLILAYPEHSDSIRTGQCHYMTRTPTAVFRTTNLNQNDMTA